MTIHAWKGYKDFAWGYDELRPVKMQAFNWYNNETMLNTPLDALDTLYIMNLTTQYHEAKELVLSQLKFKGLKERINLFETIIRVVGGLLAAYDLEGDKRLLTKCIELVDLILPAFETENGFPLNKVNLTSGVAMDRWGFTDAGLAEVGTLQLEFQYLSDVTGNPIYAQTAMYIYETLDLLPAPYPGLYKDQLQVTNLDPNLRQGGKYSVGGMSDSFYEYLLKIWLSTGERRYWDLYYKSAKAIGVYMVETSPQNGLVYIAERWHHKMNYTSGQFEHLVSLLIFSALALFVFELCTD
jgi:mannosyl-oligosaccharide alpha-1,2-mannosidase